MISVAEAGHLILEHAKPVGVESVALLEANGRILREDLRADRDFPPFDRITMDGIGICYADYAAGLRHFPIDGVQAAGAIRLQLKPGHCLEVMTGAMLPEGVDTVVPYEGLSISDGVAQIIHEHYVGPDKNIHRKGSDRSKGDTILNAGRKMSPAEIGAAATVGATPVLVSKKLRIAVISSGDELVAVEATPLPHQIRLSNSYSLHAILGQWPVELSLHHLPDDPDEIGRAHV